MAKKYWWDRDPVGCRIDFFDEHPTDESWATVVGDVKDRPESADAEPAF